MTDESGEIFDSTLYGTFRFSIGEWNAEIAFRDTELKQRPC